jgi:hypothetical protein
MTNLTTRRMEKITPILERYQDEFKRKQSFSARLFEKELKKILATGFKSIQNLMIDLYKKHPKYQELSQYYMKNITAPTIRSEFKSYMN